MVSQEYLFSSSLPEKLPSDGNNHIPTIIGPYKIDCLIEKGGMSSLYLALHKQNKNPVALKVLSKKYLQNEEVIDRFLNEGAILNKLDHPFIVKLYQYGKWEGGHYLALEFVQGTSLRDYILQQPMSLKHAVELIIDIAYALCHIHVRGIIHRDLKPENILVNDEGYIKLIDFGIARSLIDPPHSKLHSHVIGTPVYMSPEQKVDPESASYPSDIYALGLIAYEMILGRLSHGRVSVSLLPQGLQPIISRALQPSLTQRYQDVVDLIADLSAYLHSPQLSKELRAGDKLSELSEQIGLASRWLTPAKLPNIEKMETGAFFKKKGPAGGFWYDFLEVPEKNNFWLFFGDTSTEGIAGMCDAAALKALVHGTMDQSESTIAKIAHIQNLTKNSLIRLPHLLLFFCCQKISWEWESSISGKGSIFLLQHNCSQLERLTPLILSEDNILIKGSLAIGDLLFFCNDPLNTSKPALFEQLESAILKYRELSASRIAESSIRRLQSSFKDGWPSQGIALIVLRRMS